MGEKSLIELVEEGRRGRISQHEGIMARYDRYELPYKAQEWFDSVNSFAKKVEKDFNNRQVEIGPQPDMTQYQKSVAEDLEKLQKNAIYAQRYANQIQDEGKRSEYLKAIADTKAGLDSFNASIQNNGDYWGGMMTLANQAKIMQQYELSSMTSAELQEKIDQLQTEVDQAKAEQTPVDKSQSIWNKMLSSKQKDKVITDNNRLIEEKQQEITRYKQQLYYAQRDEELAKLPADVQKKLTDYIDAGIAQAWLNQGTWHGFEDTDTKFLMKNGKRYTVKELQALAKNYSTKEYYDFLDGLAAYQVDGRELAEYIQLKLGQDYVKENQKDDERVAEEYPVLSSILSILAAPGKAAGLIDTGKTALYNTITGEQKPIDFSDPVYEYALFQSNVRDQVSNNIDSDIGRFFYQTGMSLGDFATLAPLTVVPGGKAVTTLLLGGGAATDTVLDINSRGGTASQAFWGGLAAGVAEAVFEKFSLDAIVKPKNITGIKTFVKEFLRGAGIEATEEMATEITNIITDEAIMGDKSSYNLSVKQYMENGMSREEAEKEARLDLIKRVGLAGAGGFLSGGMIHGIQGGLNWAGNYRSGADIQSKGKVSDAIRLGFESDVNSAAYKAAVELSEKLAKGEKLPAAQLGGMVSDAQANMAVNGYGRSRNAPGGEFLQFIPGNGRMGIEGSDGYGGEAAQTDIRGNGGAMDWEAGGQQRTGADDGGRTSENGRVRPEDAQSFQRRNNSTDEGVAGSQQGSVHLKYNGSGAIAFKQAQNISLDSEAGKAEQGLRKLGASVVVTEGNFETNRNGLTTLHTDAATAPDGAIYISNQTKIPAEQIVSHEGLHFLQRQNSPLYDDFYGILFKNANLSSDAYKFIAGRINEEHYGGRLDLDDPDSVIPIFTELAAYIHEWLTVDPEHAKNTFGGMFRDWDAVVEASRALREAMDRGVQTEGSGEYGGEKEIDIRQYQGSPGGLDGRGEPGDGQRSGISETVEAVPGRVQRTSIRAFTKGLVGSELTFDSVKPEFLASYQQKNVDIGEQYGYTVYYIPKSSTITDGGQSITMDKVAFVIPGIKAVFAMDGTRRNFIYHELFHQFLSENRYGEQKLQKNVIKSAFRKSDAAKEYLKRYKKIYGDKVKTRDVYEEITCDLCEYALSGSQEMYNRLEGLFEPGTLDALCKEARKVFAANRTGKRVGEGSSQNPPSSDRNPRYYLEESAETNAGDVNKAHNLQAEKSAPSSADGNSGYVNNIHTSELLTSLREAGAYEGLSAYLLRQALPQAEGSSLAALVRDKQAQTPGLSRTQAVQDLAAEYVNSRLFTDADAIRQLAEARPETARQILSWLRSAESPDESLIQAEKLYSQALGEGDAPSLMPEQTSLAEANERTAKLGDSFGKMGSYVNNPGIKVDWLQYAEHGYERIAKRGMSKEQVDTIVKNGKVLLQNGGDKFAFITKEGVVVVSKEGKLITAWADSYFDDAMKNIIKALFGDS